MLACRIKEDVVASFSVIITTLLAQNLHPAECSLLPALGSSKQSSSKEVKAKFMIAGVITPTKLY